MEQHFEIIQWNDRQEEFFSERNNVATPHIASILLTEGLFASLEDFQKAMRNSFEVFLQLQIPIGEHFKSFHLDGGTGQIEQDWALSDLALYVLMLSAEASSVARASAKSFAIERIFSHFH